MRVKYFLLGLSCSLLIAACATIYPLPAFNNRVYHPCSDSETDSPIGKLCYSRCTNRGMFSDKCKEWETDIQDFNDPVTFSKFRAAGFKMSIGI